MALTSTPSQLAQQRAALFEAPQGALKGLLAAAMIAGRTPTGTEQLWPCMIPGVGVQRLFQRPCRYPQNLSARRHLNRFQVQLRGGLAA